MYIEHKILENGWIKLAEKIDGKLHRSMIAPNKPVEKYNDTIEADEDFAKYRTQVNIDAYIANSTRPQPSIDQWRNTFKVELYKLKIELDNMGDLDSIESIIAAQNKGTQLAWKNATTVRRNSPTVADLAQVKGYTPEQLDTIFKNADQIQL